MFIVGILSWWYTAGWQRCVKQFQEQVAGMVDYFSIDLLLRTLFSPYRQISAGKVRGPLGVQIRAFFDRLVSRFIGALIRLTMVIVGTVTIVINAIVGGVFTLLWGIVPILPVVGLVLWLTEWMPWLK